MKTNTTSPASDMHSPRLATSVSCELMALLLAALGTSVACAKNEDVSAPSIPPAGLYTTDIQARVVRSVGGITATIETQIDGKTGNQVVTTAVSGSPAVVQRSPGKGPVLRCVRPLTDVEAMQMGNAIKNTPCPVVQFDQNQGAGNAKAVCSAANAVIEWKYAPTAQKEVWTLTHKSKLNTDTSLGAIPAQIKDAAGNAQTIEALAGNNMTEEQRKRFAQGQRQLEQATAQANSPVAERSRLQTNAAMERELARLPPEQQAAMRQQMARMRGGAGAMEPTVVDTTERLTLTAATCPPGL